MDIVKVVYTDMDWDKYEELKGRYFDLSSYCEKWSTDQGSMVEVDITTEEALEILLDLELINKELHDELIFEVHTLFLN